MAGEREGFSLVELIIVIAIMAILIGVIALAVIPNIQRSRESKDISFLDSVASATNAAIANNQINKSGTAQIFANAAGTLSTGTNSDDTAKKIQAAVEKTISQKPTLGSSSAKDCASVDVKWTIATDGAANILVYLTAGSGQTTYAAKYIKEDGSEATQNVLKCSYLSDPEGFYVKN